MIIALHMRCLRVGLVLVLMCQGQAWAEPRQDLPALRAAAARYVTGQAMAANPDAQATVEIGAVDPRLNLPACPEPAFALATGSRPWGSGNLAASCTTPQPWNLFLTYRIALKGQALLARRPLPVGTAPAAADLVAGIVEYAGDPGRYPRDPAGLRGAILTRPLARNSPLSLDMLRLLPIISAGQKVRIVVEGPGFQVSQEGVAQAQASVGDSLRLKTPSGRLVQGTVQADGTVRIQP